jgi:hypothetical protein
VIARRRTRWWRLAAELLLVAAVAVVAGLMFARAPAKQAGDEANWLGTARYFLVLFAQHDISAEAWPDNYWTRTQPMVPRYIMGGWLWARGYEYASLDPNYDHTKKWFTNVSDGKAPGEAVLAEARIPMRALTAISAVLLYALVRVLAGPVGGLAAALLYCGSSYVPLHMVRAMGEPPFITFLLATLLVCVVAVKRGSGRSPGIWWGVLAGLLLGLAFASKLTAIIAVVAMLMWGAWALLGERLARPRSDDRGRRGVWTAGVVGVALLIFVATNPFLYRDPLGRSLLLFQNRQAEMAAQAAIDPSRAVTGLRDRIRLVWTNSLIEDTWAHTRFHWPLEAVLAIVGFVWLAARALRPQPGPEALLLLCVLGFFGGVTLALGYVLDHYFMPTATMGLMLGGLAVGWTAQAAWHAGARLLRVQRTSPAVREAQAQEALTV